LLVVPCSKFKVPSSKFKVQGSKFKVQGSKFKVWLAARFALGTLNFELETLRIFVRFTEFTAAHFGLFEIFKEAGN
jgi:hypothetical protein